MKKKSISLLLAGLLSLSTFSACGGEVKIPEFAKAEKGVMFSAYAAPTVNRGIDELTQDHYDKLAAAGFNKAIALYEGSSSVTGADTYETIEKRSKTAEEVALKVLQFAEKAGVKYYVRDWSFYGLGKNFGDITEESQFEKIISKMFDENNQYIDHPAYGGNFGFDEPNVQEMATIAWQAKYYNKYIKKNSATGGEIFINLLPAYIMDNSTNLSVNGDYTYRQYVDYYFENVIEHVGYVCWDFYPFMKNASDENYIRDMYYYNYEMMASRCKGTDYEVRTFVQAKGDFTGTRNMTGVGDFRFQIYSGMAFGTREFVYYTYGGQYGPLDCTSQDGFSLYNYKTQEYTWVYDAAKQVNNEVHAMEDAYQAYDWDGTMYNNASIMLDNQLFANLMYAQTSHPRIKSIRSTQDTLIGTFKAKDANSDAQDAFMIVNSSDPSKDKDDEVTVKFNDARALLMYRLGQKIVVELPEDGSYTFNLYPGEGRFVIPLK